MATISKAKTPRPLARTARWAELDARTNRLARAYRDLGVTPNSFVTIGLPNGLEFFEAVLAAWKLGDRQS